MVFIFQFIPCLPQLKLKISGGISFVCTVLCKLFLKITDETVTCKYCLVLGFFNVLLKNDLRSKKS